MCEGRRHPQMTTRTLGLPDMPPQFKPDGGIFKAVGMSGLPPTFDLNKNNLASKDSTSLVNAAGIRHPATTTSHHPPPFTASWLTEVARMTPLRPPERHPFSSGTITGSSVANFYQHYQSLAPRTPFFAPHAFLNPPHYIRNFSHPQQIQGFSHAMDSMSSEFPLSSTGLPSTFMRPLGPPMRPSVDMTRDLQEKSIQDLRNQRECTDSTLSSRPLELVATQASQNRSLRTPPKEHQSEPNSKKRCTTQSTAFTTPVLKPSFSPTLKDSQQTLSQIPASTRETTANVSAACLERVEEDSPSPFHPHFRKGSLVMVGENVLKVEDLQTNDFLEASKTTPELVLDPSTVGSITINTETKIATITFRFSSRNKELSVDASDDHPFFVFYKGWSSCNPERTMMKYELVVRKLAVEDVCVSLQRKLSDEKTTPEAASVMPPPKTLPKSIYGASGTSTVSAESSQPYGKLLSTSSMQHSSPKIAQCVAEGSSSSTSSPSVQTNFASVPVVCNNSFAQKILSGELNVEKASNPSCTTTWRRPSSTTYEKQKSCDDSQSNLGYSRKRRWSDPDH